MPLKDRKLHKRRGSHYRRTGRRLARSDNLDIKIIGDRGGRALLRLYIRQNYGRPNDLLVDHYFFGNGKTFDLVTRNLLPYVTRTHIFRKAKVTFREKILQHLQSETRKKCRTDQGLPTVNFSRRFSDRQPIDFSSEFFSLGNSYLNREAVLTVMADCVGKKIKIEGHMTFEINDKFNDAWDIEDKVPGNQEYPGGRPFTITARWSEILNWSGNL